MTSKATELAIIAILVILSALLLGGVIKKATSQVTETATKKFEVRL